MTAAPNEPLLTSLALMLLLVSVWVSDIPTRLPLPGNVCAAPRIWNGPVELLVPAQVFVPPTVTNAPQSLSSVPVTLFQQAASLATLVPGPSMPPIENGNG